jgi:hypothetical protein
MYIAPPPSSGTSYTALELAQKIVNIIQEFKQSHPGMGERDIHRALRLAALQTGATGRRPVILAIAIGLLLLGILAALLFGARTGR